MTSNTSIERRGRNILDSADPNLRSYYDLVTLVKIANEMQRVDLFRVMLTQMRVKVDPALDRMMSELEKWASSM